MTGDIETARLSAGRTPQGRPPLLNPGERHWKLRQGHAETVDEAIARARATMPWGKKIRGKPGLCRGVWMFAGVP